MGWYCPSCGTFNFDDYSWCPDCGPKLTRPLAKNTVATSELCLDCNKPILPEQAYVAGPRHIGHIRHG
jgi:uncharacterized membrane protein YvbJ